MKPRARTSVRCTAIALMSVALLSACVTPRKAAQRRCGKADRLLAKAVWLCPDVLARDSVQVVLPATSASTPLALRDSVDTDSLLAACDRLNAALRLQLLAGDAPVTAARTAPVREAIAAMQRTTCQWESFTDTVNGVVVKVHNIEGKPYLFVEAPPREVRVPCPPAVQRPPAPDLLDRLLDTGHRLLWWLVAALVLWFLFRRFVPPLIPRR